jgi:hypothetical protein
MPHTFDHLGPNAAAPRQDRHGAHFEIASGRSELSGKGRWETSRNRCALQFADVAIAALAVAGVTLNVNIVVHDGSEQIGNHRGTAGKPSSKVEVRA